MEACGPSMIPQLLGFATILGNRENVHDPTGRQSGHISGVALIQPAIGSGAAAPRTPSRQDPPQRAGLPVMTRNRRRLALWRH